MAPVVCTIWPFRLLYPRDLVLLDCEQDPPNSSPAHSLPRGSKYLNNERLAQTMLLIISRNLEIQNPESSLHLVLGPLGLHDHLPSSLPTIMKPIVVVVCIPVLVAHVLWLAASIGTVRPATLASLLLRYPVPNYHMICNVRILQPLCG